MDRSKTETQAAAFAYSCLLDTLVLCLLGVMPDVAPWQGSNTLFSEENQVSESYSAGMEVETGTLSTRDMYVLTSQARAVLLPCCGAMHVLHLAQQQLHQFSCSPHKLPVLSTHSPPLLHHPPFQPLMYGSLYQHKKSSILMPSVSGAPVKCQSPHRG